ncbi:MAG: hypothetical protein ACXV3C_04540 [Actinomycetes bacterium]
MPQLDITASDEHLYDVTITDDSGTETRHSVRVPEDFLEAHGVAASQEPVLVRASVLYLLEREPASSIMERFTLDDITTYFPSYVDDVLPTI